SELLDGRVIRRTFNTAVPTSIVVRPIAIYFAICFVVFRAIRDEVIEGESVMARYKINALFGLPFLVPVNSRAATKPVSTIPNRKCFSAKKTPDITSKPSVPFLPTIADETADLVKSGCVPGFGDELDPGKIRVRFDVPQHRRIRHRSP